MPEPLNEAAPQPVIAAPASAKATVPVGPLPLTVAVNDTLAPALDGLGVLVSVVLVTRTETCSPPVPANVGAMFWPGVVVASIVEGRAERGTGRSGSATSG